MTRLAITLGDPTGVGPEIVAVTLATASAEVRARTIVFGHRSALAAGAAAMGVAVPADVEVREPGPAGAMVPGAPDLVSARAQVDYLEAAIAAAQAGEVAALVTAPISKTWARKAGLPTPGHTELLAERFGVPQVTMAFYGPRLRVALATVHVPLAQVPTTLDRGRLGVTIAQLHASLRRDLGLATPRVGCAGSTRTPARAACSAPTKALVEPAISDARAAGLDVVGPLIPDAAFRDHAGGAVDALVALYHDQGLIPVKLLDFEEAVNVTLGLPIVRTSPDHGTAYDIAGRGVARATSMRAALDRAVAMLAARAAG
ncbi:MAG: 4-hydroxythreonine-4-phosphate dehydrogenase PdxA [Kofleriaceae bacterium]